MKKDKNLVRLSLQQATVREIETTEFKGMLKDLETRIRVRGILSRRKFIHGLHCQD